MGVGQLLGKLFGGDADKNQAVLRAYGKLPMYAEYRRLEVSPGTPTLFSQWMDAGRLAWVRSPTKTDEGATRPSRLMFRPPEAKEIVVASVWDSRDSLGRIFPFSFFVVCSPDVLGANALERWASATAIHAAFDSFYTEITTLGAGGDFYRLYRSRAVPLRPHDHAAIVQKLSDDARRISASAWFQAALDSQKLDAGEWFSGLVRRAQRWKANPQAAADTAFSLPVASGVSRAAQASLWVQWIDAFATGRTLGVIAPAENASLPASLSLFTRDVMPDDFQLMTTDDSGYGFAENLATIPAQADDAPPAASITPPDGSLLDWVQAQSK